MIHPERMQDPPKDSEKRTSTTEQPRKKGPPTKLVPSKRKSPRLLIMGVALAHVIVFGILFVNRDHLINKPEHRPRPNFKHQERVYEDLETGELTRIRHFTVSTDLEDTPEENPAEPEVEGPGQEIEETAISSPLRDDP